MTNDQRPEPASKSDGSVLDLHSMFFTLQGEGPFTGHRSIFVRLAGCNLQCPGCDTEYTQGRKMHSLEYVVTQVDMLAAKHNAEGCLIVITGGEPLRQTIGPFVKRLLDLGYIVQIESNGVLAPDPDLANTLAYDRGVTLVVSPKTQRINKDTEVLAHVFKYVLDHRSVDPRDGLPRLALEHPAAKGVARPPKSFEGRIYVNPYDAKDAEQNAANLKAVAQSCLQFGYIAGVQLHKLLDLE